MDRYWDQEPVFAVYLLDGVTKINCFATMCWMVCGLFVLVSGGPFQGSLQKYKIRKFRVLQGVRCRTKGEKERERKEWERRKKELVRREKDWNRKRKRDRHDSLLMITGRERERERRKEKKKEEKKKGRKRKRRKRGGEREKRREREKESQGGTPFFIFIFFLTIKPTGWTVWWIYKVPSSCIIIKVWGPKNHVNNWPSSNIY